MIKIINISFTLIIILFISSCGANQNVKSGKAWLNKKKTNGSSVNVSGTWEHGTVTHVRLWYGTSSFGKIELTQKRNKIKGFVNGGEYEVQGIISGKTIYLQFFTNNWVYYIFKLRLDNGRLIGKYLNYFPKKDKDFQKHGTLVLIKKKN